MAVRNNEDRVAARQVAHPPPALEQQDANKGSTFSFTTPTEIVELPSQGRYYPEDHPLRGVDSIEIKYMTAKDEDTLTSTSLLKKGIAIERMLQNVIVNDQVKVNDLLVGDKNALIVASRITGYGPNYETNLMCPACMNNVKYTFDLNERKVDHGYNLESAQATETENGTFIIDLPTSKVKLELRLMTSRDERTLITIAERRKKNNLPDAPLTDQFGLIIVSVNGDTNQNTIDSFVEVMPALDSQYIRQSYTAIMPNVDLNLQFVCSSCGHDEEVDLPFTADFFWPKR